MVIHCLPCSALPTQTASDAADIVAAFGIPAAAALRDVHSVVRGSKAVLFLAHMHLPVEQVLFSVHRTLLTGLMQYREIHFEEALQLPPFATRRLLV